MRIPWIPRKMLMGPVLDESIRPGAIKSRYALLINPFYSFTNRKNGSSDVSACACACSDNADDGASVHPVNGYIKHYLLHNGWTRSSCVD